MPHRALVTILGSGLSKQKLVDEELRANLRVLRKRAALQPNCYHLELCDPMGNGPTVAEMRDFCAIAERYAWPETAEDREHAIQIDEVCDSFTEREKQERRDTNKRRYLSPGQKDSTRSKLKVLLEKLTSQLSGMSEEQDDEPMPFLLNDIGYTDNATRRIDKDHTQHKSSNDLMNLWEAISVAFFKQKKYRMRGDVLFVCCKSIQARYSEILFSVLTQSNIKTGKGFNGVDAGIQQRSLASYDSSKQWDEWKDLENTPFHADMHNEKMRVAAYKEDGLDLDDAIREEDGEISDKEIAMLDSELKLEETLAIMNTREWLTDGQAP